MKHVMLILLIAFSTCPGIAQDINTNPDSVWNKLKENIIRQSSCVIDICNVLYDIDTVEINNMINDCKMLHILIDTDRVIDSTYLSIVGNKEMGLVKKTNWLLQQLEYYPYIKSDEKVYKLMDTLSDILKDYKILLAKYNNYCLINDRKDLMYRVDILNTPEPKVKFD